MIIVLQIIKKVCNDYCNTNCNNTLENIKVIEYNMHIFLNLHKKEAHNEKKDDICIDCYGIVIQCPFDDANSIF